MANQYYYTKTQTDQQAGIIGQRLRGITSDLTELVNSSVSKPAPNISSFLAALEKGFNPIPDTGLAKDYSGTGWYKATDTGTIFCKDIPDEETCTFDGVTYTCVSNLQRTLELGALAATSNITNMSSMFSGKKTFNEDISSWDVSNVTNMYGMFYASTGFNQDISSWDTSKVMDMADMFSGSTSFNQDLSGWNVVNILAQPSNFDADAAAWTLPRPVWRTDGTGEPVEPVVVLQPTGLRADYPGTGWYKATDTGIVFCKDVPENEVGLFEVDGIEYVSVYTKEDAKLHSAAAATSNITDMNSLFVNDTAPNEDISSWDVSNVTDMSNMFYGCISFNQDISGWDTSSVYAMTSMFHGCGTFNQDLSGWNVTRQKTQPYSFDKYAMSWTLPKPVWGTDGTPEPVEPVEPVEPGVTYHPTGLHADYPGTGWYRASDTGIVFCKDVPDGETGQFEEGGIEYVVVYTSSSAKYNGVRAATSNVTDMNSLFSNNTTFNEDISSWDVSNVTLAYGMFHGATAFNVDISNWDVGNVTNMYMMFRNCGSFNQDISGWNVSNVTVMGDMFYYCTVFNQDLSGWNVSNIPTPPKKFDTNTIAWTLPKPVWGTNPRGENTPD